MTARAPRPRSSRQHFRQFDATLDAAGRLERLHLAGGLFVVAGRRGGCCSARFNVVILWYGGYLNVVGHVVVQPASMRCAGSWNRTSRGLRPR